MQEEEPVELLKQKFTEYFYYIDDIRRKLIYLIIYFGIFFVAGFFFTDRIVSWIINVTAERGITIVTTSPFHLVNLAMSVGMFIAISFSIPFAIYLIYGFLKEALSKTEKKYFFILLPISFILFLAGFTYGAVILYFYLDIIVNLSGHFGVQNYWDVSSFLSQMISAALWIGLVFQFPVVLTFLIRIGSVDVGFLRKNRKYAIAIIFIFVGFLPPPDIFSTFIEAAPLLVLYEITIIINSIINYRKNKQLARKVA